MRSKCKRLHAPEPILGALIVSPAQASQLWLFREIGILLPNNQRQHRTLYIQKDVLPYALC